MAKTASIARLIKDIKRLHAKYAEDLPSEDIDAIFRHLEGPYHEGPDPSVILGKYGTPELAEQMDRIIRGAPRIPEEMTTYRGTSVEGAVPKNQYPFTTSYDPSPAETYAESWMGNPKNPALMMEIEVPRGSPGLMFDEETLEEITGQMLPFGDELELLLPSSKLEHLRRSVKDIGDPTGETLRLEQKRYIPPYKARGGLV